MQIREALQWGTNQLKATVETADLDVMLLLAYILKQSRVFLIAHPTQCLDPLAFDCFQKLIKRRVAGEPVAYLLGQSEFWSLPLKVSSNCLIPRPETELLVEKILDYYPAEDTIRIADLGTGSGAIALALNKMRPHWQIVATDISEAALILAKTNAERLNLTHITFLQGNWCAALKCCEPFHTIVSNPPYLLENDPRLHQSLRYEPSSALAAGPDGLADFYRIISQAQAHLKPGGSLFLEQGYDQALQVKQILQKYDYQAIQQHYDLSGILRVSMGCVMVK